MTIYLSENIKRLRHEKELTQEALAEFLGVTLWSCIFYQINRENAIILLKKLKNIDKFKKSAIISCAEMICHVVEE